MCPVLHMWLNGWTNKPNQTNIIIFYSICHVTGHTKYIHNFVFIKYYKGNKNGVDEKRNELSNN